MPEQRGRLLPRRELEERGQEVAAEKIEATITTGH